MDLLKHMHSSLRWAVLAVLIYALFRAISGLRSGKPFGEDDRKAGLLTTIVCDLQLLMGLALYFLGPMGLKNIQNNGMSTVMQNPLARFFAVEHLSMMLLAIILIHIGSARSKRGATDAAKHKAALIFYGIGLLLILASIPWPFQAKFSHLGWM
jgi:hypothetical protein